MERKASTIGLWMLGLFLVAAPAVAGGSCTSAMLNESLTLPDGSRHDAGLLTLCATRDYSPVATLHKTFVDGMPIAFFLSRRGEAEGSADGRPVMMFRRDAKGRLHLSGYSVPSSGGRQVTYRLGRQPGPVRPHVQTETTLLAGNAKQNVGNGTILQAANVR